jgi:hypothetical protein
VCVYCVLQVVVLLQLDLEQCLTDHIANVTVTRQVTVNCTSLKFYCMRTNTAALHASCCAYLHRTSHYVTRRAVQYYQCCVIASVQLQLLCYY